MVKSVWPRSMVFYSSINSVDNNYVHRKSVVCTIVICKWASFVETTKQENLGLWVEIKFKGQSEQRVTLIKAYRPVYGRFISNSGTVWRQQYDYITDKEIGTIEDEIDPIRRMISELETSIENYQGKNHKVILMLDAN